MNPHLKEDMLKNLSNLQFCEKRNSWHRNLYIFDCQSINSLISLVAHDKALGVVKNFKLESSMSNPIFQLENDKNIFLLDKGKKILEGN